MAESGASSSEPYKTSHVDIDSILDQDEVVIRNSFSRGKSQIAESSDEESEGITEAQSDGEDSAEEEARAFYHTFDKDKARHVSPTHSPNPYTHPPVLKHKLDFDWGSDEEIRETVKAGERKKAGMLVCVGLSSIVSDAEIEWCLRYYDMGCIWVRPHPEMRPHIFDYNPRLRIPRMVLTPKLVKLGIGPPLHHYFKAIIE